MILYQVFQINYSSYSGGEEQIIKWLFTTFEKANKLAKSMYKNSIKYRWVEWTYDTVQEGNYLEYQEAFWGGVEIISKYIVVELDFEIDFETEIQI